MKTIAIAALVFGAFLLGSSHPEAKDDSMAEFCRRFNAKIRPQAEAYERLREKAKRAGNDLEVELWMVRADVLNDIGVGICGTSVISHSAVVHTSADSRPSGELQ